MQLKLQWFVVATKINQEATAVENLLSQGYETYCPTMLVDKMMRGKLKTVKEYVFPGYAFVQFDPAIQAASTINYSYGVQKLIGFGGVLLAMPDKTLEALRNRLQAPKRYQDETKHCAKSGDRVIITAGPFKGIEAILLEPSGAARSTILISLLNCKTPMDIENQNIAAV